MWEGQGKLRELKERELGSLDQQGSPPFNIRRRKQLRHSLGAKAIVDGFIPVPVYTRVQVSDESFQDCRYTQEEQMHDMHEAKMYGKHMSLIDEMKGIISEELGLNEEESNAEWDFL